MGFIDWFWILKIYFYFNLKELDRDVFFIESMLYFYRLKCFRKVLIFNVRKFLRSLRRVFLLDCDRKFIFLWIIEDI